MPADIRRKYGATEKELRRKLKPKATFQLDQSDYEARLLVETRRVLGIRAYQVPIAKFTAQDLDEWEVCVAWARAKLKGEDVGDYPPALPILDKLVKTERKGRDERAKWRKRYTAQTSAIARESEPVRL